MRNRHYQTGKLQRTALHQHENWCIITTLLLRKSSQLGLLGIIYSPAESMSIPTLHVEPQTNPLHLCHCRTLTPGPAPWTLTPAPPGPAPLVPPDADGTGAVGVGAPFDGRVGVYKVAEIETGVLLVERLRH